MIISSVPFKCKLKSSLTQHSIEYRGISMTCKISYINQFAARQFGFGVTQGVVGTEKGQQVWVLLEYGAANWLH